MSMKLSSNKESLHISISGDLDVEAVETLIVQLVTKRASMLPEVPNSPPTLEGTAHHEPLISMMNNPSFQIALLQNGEFRFWLHNPGLGWLAFNMPYENSCVIRDYLIANTPKTKPRPNLIGQQQRERDLPH